MRRPDYHGSFQHPVRAFLIGTGLVVLLLGGWAIGVEAGGTPSADLTTKVVTRLGQPKLELVTVTDPVVSTVVSDQTRIVRVPGVGATRVIVVHTGGRDVVAYLPVSEQSALTASAVEPLTVYVPQPTTITETVTVTEPASTVTETDTVTVTDPGTVATTDQPPPSSGG